MVFLSGNQVTRLVNRMEVLSEELHPSWQSGLCTTGYPRQPNAFVISCSEWLPFDCFYSSVSQAIPHGSSIIFDKREAISIDTDFLSWFLGLCLRMHRFMGYRHLNLLAGSLIDSWWSNQLFASKASVSKDGFPSSFES